VTARPPLIILAGPTAAGKTNLAIEVAQALDAEIISADSRQVYRGFDIGTAKATAAERAAAPHHLLDVVDPDTSFDVSRFVTLARAACDEIRGRGRLPLVVGGTGLYLRALCGGLAPVPGRDPALRAQLEAERRADGDAALHRRLAVVDPAAAARIPEADFVRVARALEVHALTGRPLSEHQREHRFSDRPFRTLWFVVDRQREELVRRIETRTQVMFSAGLIEEATALRARWGDNPLLDTLGYREALALADGARSHAAAIAQTATRTRRYAKRQRTWLRKEPVDHWLLAPAPAQLLELIGKSSLLSDPAAV